MKKFEEDPCLPAEPSTEAFFLPGSRLSILLVHGFGGTPYEMRYLGERLNRSGARVLGVRLAGHARTPEDLAATAHYNWYESVVDGLEQLRAYDDPIVVAGHSMGAVLGSRLAIDRREAINGLVLMAPAFFLSFNRRAVLRLIEPFIQFAENTYMHRSIHPRHKLMQLRAIVNLHQLARLVRMRLGEIVQPTLLIHSRRDHVCPFYKNVAFVMSHLGSADKRTVTLEESSHVITMDSEKDRVADEVEAFAVQFRSGVY
jgi:carboxylesterase